MDREIKFREWDGHKMNYDPGHNPGDMQATLFNEELNDTSRIFMQFTGLKDKNGNDVYEGDITDAGETVIFGNGAFRTSHKDDTEGTLLTSSRTRLIEIVGNIHENAELL